MKALSSLAIREAYVELVPQFEKDTGQKVATVWAGMVDIRKRMLAGEIVDLVIGSAAAVDELIGLGKLASGSRVDLVTSGVAVAVRAGAPKPDLGSAEALKRALAGARSVGYSSGPSGVYLSGVFEKWGIPREKIVQTPPGTPVGPFIARGEVEIGFQQLSELLPIPGIDLAGPLPPDLQLVTTFSGAIHVQAPERNVAEQWLRFLKSPAAAPAIRKHGLEPA